MPKPFELQTFKANLAAETQQPASAVTKSIDDGRLDSFEQGYKAGWDDSHASHEANQNNISADFARNLNELSFTYLEVRSTIVRALEPLLREMVSKVLPRIAQASLSEIVIDQIMELVDSQSSLPIELLVSTQDKAALEHLSENQTELPISIVEEKSIGAGQVFIRLGESEIQLDIDGVLDGFENAVTGFINSEEKVFAHG